MVDRGARHLILAGRKPASAKALEAVNQLEQAGATVTLVRADVSDATAVVQMLATIARDAPPLRGIVHAAGSTDDGALLQQTAERIAAVLAPKVAGAWNLHTLTTGIDLDFFVFFSSIASVFGSPGQAGYAAANAYMDALAHHRRAAGLPGLSVNWGPWADAGMAAATAKRAERWWASCGVSGIVPARGLEALERLLQAERTQVVVVQADWRKFMEQFPDALRSPLLSGIALESKSANRAKQPSAERGQLLRLLDEAVPEQREALVAGYVKNLAMRVLALDPTDALDTARPLQELGLDSLMALELTRSLGEAANLSLPATLLFNHPSIDMLAEHLSRKLLTAIPAAVTTPVPSRPDSEAESLAALAQLDNLSRTEVEALLDDELAEFEELIGGEAR